MSDKNTLYTDVRTTNRRKRNSSPSKSTKCYSPVIIRDKTSVHEDGTRSYPEHIPPTIKCKLPVIKTKVKYLNLECIKPQRAGIILYTVVDDATLFGLGLDAATHDLTDFGGGVVYKTDGNVVIGALREFQEETLGIFNKLTPDDLNMCPVIYDQSNLIIFMHIDVDPEQVCINFNQKYCDSMSDRPEVCGITWLSWEDFQRSIHIRGNIFTRVQRFLSRAGDFSYIL